jgi:hypothetical protein
VSNKIEMFVDAKFEQKGLKSCSQWALHCEIMKNPHAGKIGERKSDVRLLKRNRTKSSHAGKIGEGESGVRC